MINHICLLCFIFCVFNVNALDYSYEDSMSDDDYQIFEESLDSVYSQEQSIESPLQDFTNNDPDDNDISSFELFVDPITNLDCTDYCFEGTCMFLSCGFTGCTIRSSLRMSHRNPDFVVSAFSELGDNPWTEFRLIWGDLEKSVGESVISWIGSSADTGGGKTTTKASKGGTGNKVLSTTFREVDVAGYYYDFSQIDDDYFCDSTTKPFVPYYSSGFDAYLWRTGLTDILYTPLIFTESIGIPYIKEWGSLYWRTGFIKQLNPAKANAVLSMRAVNIVSSNNNSRVYMPSTGTPSGSSQKFFFTPSTTKADGSDGSAWQMRLPKKDDTCVVFDEIAESENTASYSDWTTDRWKTNKSPSVYIVWRKYECCQRKGSYINTVPLHICI
ncbi:hypothetical protein DS885_03970 [Psychromonas sp. B3M02]|uniref:TraU family protein n=1 Tax=Psychromonas sp. B3M02 TaxID=2267226 RepID=UPI000DE836AF|nr:TraU family protein [Psychromonas sp. B3M02]RBW47314.1 hypothetical protein DS885_03970 [Psychromonas sp. B3M02]